MGNKKYWQINCKNCGVKIKFPAMVRGQIFCEELNLKFDLDFTNLKKEYVYENEFGGNTFKIQTKDFALSINCKPCNHTFSYLFTEFENVD